MLMDPEYEQPYFLKGVILDVNGVIIPKVRISKKEILFYKNKCSGCGRCRDLSTDNDSFFCFNDAKEICGFPFEKAL